MTHPISSNAIAQTTVVSNGFPITQVIQARDQAVPPEQVVDPASFPEPDYDAQFNDWQELHLGRYGY